MKLTQFGIFLKKLMICAKQNAILAVKFTHSVVINQNSKQYVIGNSSKEISVYTADKCCKRAALFSLAGQLYADRRCSLSSVNAEKLLFLTYNIFLLGFNY